MTPTNWPLTLPLVVAAIGCAYLGWAVPIVGQALRYGDVLQPPELVDRVVRALYVGVGCLPVLFAVVLPFPRVHSGLVVAGWAGRARRCPGVVVRLETAESHALSAVRPGR